jgi:hypothetical protein
LREKFRFDRRRDLVIVLPSIPKERVDLINEDDRGLHLPSEREQTRDELVALSVPLVRERAEGDVDLRSKTSADTGSAGALESELAKC